MSTTIRSTSDSFLSQANALGQGFNIYGAYNDDSLMRPLFDFTAAPTQTFTLLGTTYDIPAMVQGIQSTETHFTEGAFRTREEFQNSIAAFAGVEASKGAFSGQMEAAFSRESSDIFEYDYAYKNAYIQMARLSLNPDVNFLTSDFAAAIDALPTDLSDPSLVAFANFFGMYGVYYTASVMLGASLEFYSAIQIQDQSDLQTMSAMVNAQYDATIASGSVDAGISNTDDWKSFYHNSSSWLDATGGDPTMAGHLSGKDPRNPSGDTVKAYNDWLASINTAPAVVGFGVRGIWELCGAKAVTVQRAWELYGEAMHPRLHIDSSAPAIDGGPVVSIGRLIRPTDDPTGTIGWQIVLLDPKDVLTDAGVKLNRFYTFSVENNDYRNANDRIVNDIKLVEASVPGAILIAVSFGMQFVYGPTGDFYALLRNSGGGTQLQAWENTADFGSLTPFPYYTAYALLGRLNIGPGLGIEAYQCKETGEKVETSLDAFFYRLADGDPYSFGLAPNTQ